MIEQQEPRQKKTPGLMTGSPEELAFPAPLVTPVMLLLLQTYIGYCM